MSWFRDELVNNAYKFDFPIHKPYYQLSEDQKELIWNGNTYFQGLNDFFKETLQEHKIDFHHPLIDDETARKYKFEIRNNLRTYLE